MIINCLTNKDLAILFVTKFTETFA